jgi:hypothetical protein
MILCTGVAAALAAAAVPALAADPGEGTVSASAPKVSWKGQSINGGATTIPAVGNGGAPVCQAPSCDTFALTVKDSADLIVFADAPDSGGFTMVQIVKPDGEKVYNSGAEGETSTKVRIKKAPAGDYKVEIATNALDPMEYSAYAELVVPPPPVAPAQPGATPTPAPTTAPPATTAPQAEPGANLGLKTRSLSARRAKKKPALVVTADREVTQVKATLKKGKKVVGKASLAKLAGSGKLTFKLRKALKAGSYTVSLSAKQGTRTVGLAAKLKVKH